MTKKRILIYGKKLLLYFHVTAKSSHGIPFQPIALVFDVYVCGEKKKLTRMDQQFVDASNLYTLANRDRVRRKILFSNRDSNVLGQRPK